MQQFNAIMVEPKWGPTGKEVYQRTYSRKKYNGENEKWIDTVTRVVDGNLSLVPSHRVRVGEREELIDAIYNFRILPAGRHLWMSGVEGRQFLFNCHVAGWGDSFFEHFAFTFNQLMQGGGVGSNYSSKYVNKYVIRTNVEVHIVCSPEHENYEDLKPYLSDRYDPDWIGAYQVEDSREGWTSVLSSLIDFAEYPYSVGGELQDAILVVDVSNIRPSGRRIKSFGGTSAGPVPFARMMLEVASVLREAHHDGLSGRHAMSIDHAIATCVVSGNVRRSARMAVMHWNDPEIEWFLQCKKDGMQYWSTNISVEIDDDFINLLQDDMGGEETAKAKLVYKAIVEGMLNNGEPGIWSSSLSNVGEPNPVIATNPCGEIALEAWENCNLGHINLDAFVDGNGRVDYLSLLYHHELMARFLIRATFGDITDEKQRKIVERNRRIGVGHFGFAGFLAKQGILYSDAPNSTVTTTDGVTIRLETLLAFAKIRVRKASRNYAHDLRIPQPVKTTTVAPTGTIAKLAGRTEGIHPPYARYFIRRIRYSMVDPGQVRAVQDFRKQGYNVVEDIYAPNTWVVEIPTKENLVNEVEAMGIDSRFVQTVDEISLESMLEVQEMYQQHYADNAVSFTINVPAGEYSIEEVQEILLKFLPTLKGTTMMVDESRLLAPYERITENMYYSMSGQTVDDSYDEMCASGACPVR